MQATAFDPSTYQTTIGEEVTWLNTAARMQTVTVTTSPEEATYFASGGFDSYEAAEEAWHDDQRGGFGVNDEFTYTFEKLERTCIAQFRLAKRWKGQSSSKMQTIRSISRRLSSIHRLRLAMLRIDRDDNCTNDDDKR